MLKRKLRLLQFGVTVLALAAMSACGGGDGDDGAVGGGPVAEPGSLAECLGPRRYNSTATYSVEQGPVKAIRIEEESSGIPAQYNGKNVERSDGTATWEFSAPNDVAGRTLVISSSMYYTDDEDSFIRRVFRTTSTEKWEDEENPVTSTIYTLDPPAIIEESTNPPINEPIRVEQRGIAETTENGETHTRRVDGWVEMTYLGQEEVTVPAGQFVACKVSKLFPNDKKEISWIMKNTGVPVKSETQSKNEHPGSDKLLSYSID